MILSALPCARSQAHRAGSRILDSKSELQRQQQQHTLLIMSKLSWLTCPHNLTQFSAEQSEIKPGRPKTKTLGRCTLLLRAPALKQNRLCPKM